MTKVKTSGGEGRRLKDEKMIILGNKWKRNERCRKRGGER